MKDLFSAQSDAYARFRPGYPDALFAFLFEHCLSFQRAWDAATGNGQIALCLAKRFAHVYATDLSRTQLQQAPEHSNVHYAVEAAETTCLPPDSFDLITVGQAAHWFDLERFYVQVQRLLKPGGLLALVGYSRPQLPSEVDALVEHLYTNILGEYWEPERCLVEEEYRSLPFPFQEITLPKMFSTYAWTRAQLIGYLSTWSSVQRYMESAGQSPFSADWLEHLAIIWPENEIRQVYFPIFGRIGRYSS